jgi:hypothetical protein
MLIAVHHVIRDGGRMTAALCLRAAARNTVRTAAAMDSAGLFVSPISSTTVIEVD